MSTQAPLSLKDIVGGGYGDFWRFQGRYRVLKGSRGSKKSKTTALWYIVHLMAHPEANLLVVRKTFRTLKDSCFTELKWAIGRLQVGAYWRVTESPLQLEYRPTGQKVYFRGLDDPMKVTSITVDHGALCWLWVEEAYEIPKEEDFRMLDESIRGQVGEGLFKQITLTFNPWNEQHWLKAAFFDRESPDILALTTTYLCNEWLDEADKKVFTEMEQNNPRRYQVAGLGNWGIVDGLVFENWKVEEFDLENLRKEAGLEAVFGLDFGYTTDPSALFCGLAHTGLQKLYVFDEIYEKGLIMDDLYEKIQAKGYAKERVDADYSNSEGIARLRRMGMSRIRSVKKGPNSIQNGVDFLQSYQIIIHPRCKNFHKEISGYTWQEDRFGKKINLPEDKDNHLMDAMRYAMRQKMRGSVFSFD